MGAAGDGGLISTGDGAVAERVRLLRHHGQDRKDVHEEIGFNSRLDDMQAAVLRVRLTHLDAMTKARRQVAAWYRDALAPLPVELPHEAEWADHIWYLYVVRVDANERDRVVAGLRERGIGCAVHYSIPLSRQPAMVRAGITGPPVPEAEKIAARQLAIPMDPAMTAADVDAVAAALREVLA
jgi:dTDP-4-amino-4,6-dideoxygalactose transaminase